MTTARHHPIAIHHHFAWVALATGVLLLVPLGAMQVTTEVNWTLGDFITMGLLLFAAGSALVMIARKVSPRRRLAAGMLVTAVFLYIWAELAVGIFTHLGS